MVDVKLSINKQLSNIVTILHVMSLSGYSELEPYYSFVWKIKFCQNDTTVILRSIADKVTLFWKMIVSYFNKRHFVTLKQIFPGKFQWYMKTSIGKCYMLLAMPVSSNLLKRLWNTFTELVHQMTPFSRN